MPNAETKILRVLVVVVIAFLVMAFWFMSAAVDNASAVDCSLYNEGLSEISE